MANELESADRHLQAMEDALDECNMVGLRAARTRMLEYANAHAIAAIALELRVIARDTKWVQDEELVRLRRTVGVS